MAMQLQAGKLFHQWAEMLGTRISEMLDVEMEEQGGSAAAMHAFVTDETRQKQLLQEDEEEDFLDEASVNPCGGGCPTALKIVACVLLLEITAFLRETYKNLPKSFIKYSTTGSHHHHHHSS